MTTSGFCERCGAPVKIQIDTIEHVPCEVFYLCEYCGFTREWAYGAYGECDTEHGWDFDEQGEPIRRIDLMPMDRSRYPSNWPEIALRVKEEAGWICEKCGKQCRRPGEPFDTHQRTLTVSHKNHKPEDCRRENLQALCAPCHLAYDAEHHAETRRNNKNQLRIEY